MKNSYYFLINSLEWWGAERVTINFANNLTKEWKEIYIITLKSLNFYELPSWVRYIPLSHIKNNLLMFLLIPRYVCKFKKIVKKYNLSDGMSLLEVANFVHILARKHATISFRIHVSFFKWLLWGVYKLLIRLLYPRVWKIVVNSMENKYDLAEYLHVPENKIEVVYNPVDKEKIKKMRLEEISDELQQKIAWKKKVFITTWRLVWQKHHEKIINALLMLYKSIDKNRIYLIVWDWPEKNKLEKLVKKIWLHENIIFCWEQKNVFKYLNVADIFVYASEVEWFPNVLIEAREMWLPIITSDFKSGAKEVVLGEYTKNIWKNIEYPYQGKYWFLLDLHHYENQFLEVYKKL